MFGFLVILGWPLIELPLLGRTRRMPNLRSPRVTFQVGAPDVGFMPNSNRVT
jgi:hypothetical protein